MEPKEPQMRLRLFAISFAATFLLLSVVAMAVILHTYNGRKARPPQEEGLVTENYLPRQEDALTVLVIGADAPPAQGHTFILARFDPVKGRVPLLTLSGETALPYRGGVTTLAETYSSTGPRGVKESLAAALAIPIDRYVQVEEDAFIRLVNLLGTVEYNLPGSIEFREENLSLRLPAGRQLLSGQAVSAVVRHTGYSGGELARVSATTNLACSMLNSKLPLLAAEGSEELYQYVTRLVDTDITYNDCEQRLPAARFLLSLSPRPAESVAVMGSTDDLGRFTLSPASLANIQDAFGEGEVSPASMPYTLGMSSNHQLRWGGADAQLPGNPQTAAR